jgi:hypothetical protein
MARTRKSRTRNATTEDSLPADLYDYARPPGIRTRDGGRWGIDAVHKVLTRTTYVGRHRFNTKSWKTRERKPETEVVEMMVPPIIEVAGKLRVRPSRKGPFWGRYGRL